MSYNKELIETENGELYYTNGLGDVYKLSLPTEDNKDKKTHEEKMEEIAETRLDYIYLNAGITWLKNQMRESAKKHGIELPTTRKDLIDELREKKNAKWREDVNSKQYKRRKNKILQEKLKSGKLIPESEIKLDKDVIATLETIEKSKESRKLPERKSMDLEC